MAAAYAALVSLSHILQQILHPPPTHHFIFPRESVESLRDKVCVLIDFLECFPSRRIEKIGHVEARIIDAAHEAEDIIESDVVTQIQKKHAKRRAPRSDDQQIVLGALHGCIAKVMERFISIEKYLPDLKSVEDMKRPDQTSSTSGSSKDIMVGFDEHLDQLKSGLASDDRSLVVIPIVGMGGIGKTTLAKNVFKDPLIIEIFDCFAWVRLSQEYKAQDVVRALLRQINSTIIDQGNESSNDELGVLLHKELFGRRYFIVLDDVWDIEAWDKLKRYLPAGNNSSRILVTTRLLNLATDLGSCRPHKMTLLDEEKSWDLIHEYVKEDCPVELEEIGRSIARGCGGLPLALVAIGGLLAKSEKTSGFWKYVETDVTSIANYADGDEKCIEILRMSYSQLPVHLKPCFLYLAAFPKHFEIRVSRLIKLWVAEGFIKQTDNKILEEVAQGYLKDLLDRNLVMRSKPGRSGKGIKKCNIHDLMRELCTNEAEKSKFLWFDHTNVINSEKMENERRLCVHTSGKELRPGIHNRSLLSYSAWESRRRVARGLNLVRVLDVVDSYSVDEISWLTNSRYITCAIPTELNVPCFEFVSLLWNLQTLAFSAPIALPSEFWQMSQLRHLNIPGITLTDPGDDEPVVLENLQTLATVRNFTFSQNVVTRIRNVKKLGIDCDASFGLSNVASLDKLESLVLKCRGSWKNMGFPKSLRKLTLSYCQIPWEEMSIVGSLPDLEALKLQKRATVGRKWSPNEGEFVRLKFLLIDWCQLENWEADSSHFPSLETLQLVGVRMEKFPVDLAEIATLQTIDLNYCSEALLLSAKTMSEIREEFGYEDIQIRSFPSGASRSRKRNLVGLEDDVEKLKGYLLQESKELDVICIFGMGGIGKTTLAGEIYRDPEIQYKFPTRLWLTASLEVSERSMFLYMLKEFTALSDDIYHKSIVELADLVADFLRYAKLLLVVDDLWSLHGWYRLKYALPNTGKVLITTSLVNVCRSVNPFREPHMLRFLSREDSWLLLCLEVFGKPEFPSNLEAEGKRIAHQSRGLPLAVVLVGGLLVKKLAESNEESALAEALDEVSRSFFSAEFGVKSIEQVVTLSYEKLPHHLRQCFLYVGMFPEDYKIPAWKLIRLWIAEGFIQQEDNNISLEETAEKYLDDLINSNLLRVDKLNADGKVKTIGIHGVLRYICFKKVTDEGGNFFKYIHMSYSEVSKEVSEEHEYQRLCIHSNVLHFLSRKPYCPSVRSFLCFSREDFVVDQPKYTCAIAAGFKLLRVLDIMPLRVTPLPKPALGKRIVRKIKKQIGWGRGASTLPMDPQLYKLLHLRYLALSLDSPLLPADFSKFRNIQTLIVHTTSPTLDVRADILNMIELRHFKTNASATLPNPSASSEGGESIQTLGMISPESCTEQVLGRARNLKKLGVRGKLALLLEDENRSFHSLGKLEDLEKLKLINDDDAYPLLTLPLAEKFPIKLRSLTLCRTAIDWSYMSVLGSLENLEVLKLKDYAFRGKSWEATDGGFPHLQFLHIERTDLEMWVASHDHFPRLKHLVLRNCKDLQKLPLGLADVPNFRRLDLHRCSRAAASSAKKISEAKKMQKDQQQSANVRSFSLNVSS